MSAKSLNKWDVMGHLISMATSAWAAGTVGFSVFAIARHFGASEIGVATCTIVAAIGATVTAATFIIDTAVNSLHARLDTIVDELERSRADRERFH